MGEWQLSDLCVLQRPGSPGGLSIVGVARPRRILTIDPASELGEDRVDLCVRPGQCVPAVRQRHPDMAGVAQQPKVARVGAVAVDVSISVPGEEQSTHEPPSRSMMCLLAARDRYRANES